MSDRRRTTRIHERREAHKSLSPSLSPDAEPTSFSRAGVWLSRPAAVRFQFTTGDGPPRIESKHLDLVVVRSGLLWLRNPSDSGRGCNGGALASLPTIYSSFPTHYAIEKRATKDQKAVKRAAPPEIAKAEPHTAVSSLRRPLEPILSRWR